MFSQQHHVYILVMSSYEDDWVLLGLLTYFCLKTLIMFNSSIVQSGAKEQKLQGRRH